MIKFTWLLLLLTMFGCTQNPSPKMSTFSPLITQGNGDFGLVSYGEISHKTFVFTNNTDAPISLSPTIVQSENNFQIAFNLGCNEILPKNQCSIKVIFNSLNKLAGNYEAILNTGLEEIPLSSSIASIPSVAYEFYLNNQKINSTLDFGTIGSNEVKLFLLKIKNNSPMNGNLSSASIGSHPQVQIFPSSCTSVTLKPGQSCISKLIVKGNEVAGPISTSVTFDQQAVQISGTNEIINLTANLVAFNPVIELGDIVEENNRKMQSIILKNTGSGLGNIEEISLPEEYTLASNNCSNVRPGNSCIIRLVYSKPENLEKGQYTDQVSLGDTQLDLQINHVSAPNKLQQLVFNLPDYAVTGTCVPVSLSLLDTEGLPHLESSLRTIFASLPTYSDNNCSALTAVEINPFSSSTTFYIKSLVDEMVELNLTYNSVSKSGSYRSYLPFTTSNFEVLKNNTALLAVSGGVPPYLYSISQGQGNISNQNYNPNNYVGSVTISVTDSIGNVSYIQGQVYELLSATLSLSVISINNSSSILISGGKPPFNFSGDNLVQISPEGLVSSLNNSGTSNIVVTDSFNQQQSLVLTINPPLSMSQNISLLITESYSLSPSGGVPPYTYNLTGAGSLTNNIYTASNNPSTAQITVTDSVGNSLTSEINVNSNLELSLGDCSYAIPEGNTCSVSAVGGIGNKTFSTDKGTIDSTSGQFYGVCENNVGSSIITVVDDYGNTASETFNYPCIYKSCGIIHHKGYSTVSGNFWIDPDGYRIGTAPVYSYCEFDSNGAWTLASRLNTNDSTTQNYFSTNFWNSSSYGVLDNSSDYMSAYYGINNYFHRIKLQYSYAGNGKIESIYQNLDNSITLKNSLNLSLSNSNPSWGKIYSNGTTADSFFGSALVFNTVGNGEDYSRMWYNLVGISACNQGGSIGHNGDYPSNNWFWEVARGSSLMPTDCQHNTYKLGVGTNYDKKAWGGTAISPVEFYNEGVMKIFIADNEVLPVSCDDAYTRNFPRKDGTPMSSGLYSIDPDGYNYGNAPFDVYCDMRPDGGWTLIVGFKGDNGAFQLSIVDNPSGGWTRTAETGSFLGTNLNYTNAYWSAAYGRVRGSQLRIDNRSDYLTWTLPAKDTFYNYIWGSRKTNYSAASGGSGFSFNSALSYRTGVNSSNLSLRWGYALKARCADGRSGSTDHAVIGFTSDTSASGYYCEGFGYPEFGNHGHRYNTRWYAETISGTISGASAAWRTDSRHYLIWIK